MTVAVEELINILKQEKSPIVQGKILYQLTKKEGVLLTKIAQILNKKPSALSHLIRLNKLPETIIDGYLGNIISLSHLYVISRLDDEQSMLEIYEQVLEKNLSVAEVEELVRQKKYQVKSEGDYFPDKQLINLKKILQKQNIDLKLIQSRIKTRLILTFKGNLKQASKFLKKFFYGLKKSFLTAGGEDF